MPNRPPTHQPVRIPCVRVAPRKGKTAARGYGNRWQIAARTYLLAHPVCTHCGEMATQVDHIIPHKGDHQRMWSESNWQALCAHCHGKKSAQERSTS